MLFCILLANSKIKVKKTGMQADKNKFLTSIKSIQTPIKGTRQQNKNRMQYYILLNGAKQGPFTLEELYKQNLSRQTMVWKTGMPDWVMAKDMPELADLIAQLPPDIPTQAPNQKQNTEDKPMMPKSWLVESILVTLFCCLPFGIVGIIYSTQISSNYNCGNYIAAEEASKNAGKWTKIGFWVGLTAWLLYIIFWVIIGIIGTTASCGALMFL